MKIDQREYWPPIAGGEEIDPDLDVGLDPDPEGAKGEGGEYVEADPETRKQLLGKYLIDGKPVERWGDLYGRYKQLEELGDPKDIREKLGQLDQYNQQIESYRKTSSMSDEEKEARANAERIKGELLKIFPGLSKLDKIDEFEKSNFEAKMERASTHLKGLLTKNKISMSDRQRDRYEDSILGVMSEEDKAKLYKGDYSVIDKSVEDDLKDGLLSTLKSSSNAPQQPTQTPPKRHPAGGTGPKPQEKGKLDLKQIENDAFARLQAASSKAE